MSIKDSFRNFFGLDDEIEPVDDYSPSNEYESEATHRPMIQPRGKVIPMGKRQANQKSSIHIIEPRVYSESERIVDYLLNNESVLLNFQRMEHDQAVKVIDFVAGSDRKSVV